MTSPLGGPAARSAEEPTRDPAVNPASVAPRSTPIDRTPRRELDPSRRGEAGSGWWIGPVGIAGALALVGGASLASKRFGLNLGLGKDGGLIGVVGQTRLSPKHSVYLVRVADRVLILGTGPGGSPAPLGEVTDPLELARLIPQRSPRGIGSPPPVKLAGMARPIGFDQRIGDDE